MPESTSPNMKVAIVTGANSGVGMSLCIMLAKTHKVFAGVRSPTDEKCKDINAAAKAAGVDANLEVIELDVNKDVKPAVESVLAKTNGKCDILVNNAGYSLLGSVEQVTDEQIFEQFNTNFFGVVRMQKAVLPAMRKQKSGLIINVSSIGGIYGQPFNDLYCASKFAIEGLAESQCALFKTFGVDIVSVEPGAINTSFIKNMQQPKPEDTPAEYAAPMQSTLDAYSKSFGMGQTPDQVAEVIMEKVVNVENPPLRVQTTPLIEKVAGMQITDTTGMAGVKNSADRFLNGLTNL